ncbi:arsenic transporter [Luteibacter sp. PPL201]|uniref:Arsenic transporter n=1 Tax=Luteibacter sahnii TaxID=3021977 RepID=A0ABT6BCP6_9GAMM
MSLQVVSWIVVALAVLGVVARPLKWPEAIWAVAGAVIVVSIGGLHWRDAVEAVGKGTDVYLFLIGMMLLSELGRREGLFDWIAAIAVNHAHGSPKRLFILVYLIGIVTTTFLSNDATAVVMTPAVFAVARKADAKPLPLLFICAFIANAASFVLPISNPANLVMYDGHLPALLPWIERFGLAALIAIVVTFGCLYATQRRALAGECARSVEVPSLSVGGRVALVAIAVTAVVLLAASALRIELGAPTAVMGVLAVVAVLVRNREGPLPILREVSWSVLPLVAGLFVLVEVLLKTGVVDLLARQLSALASRGVQDGAWTASLLTALASNVANNLPVGLLASATMAQADVPSRIVDATLVGVDLGPNLSITGSLATILWLQAVRREGEDVGFVSFLRIGVVVMVPALLLSLAALLAFG